MPSHFPNPRFFAFALLTLAFTPLNAQDVTIGTPVTFTRHDDDPNREPLKLWPSPKPRYPDEWRGTNNYGYAITFSPTEHEIKYRNTEPITYAATVLYGQTTHQKIYNECSKVVGDLKWQNATLDPDDPRRAWVAYIFNPASASATKKTAAPRLLEVTPAFLDVREFTSKGANISKNNRVARTDVTVGPAGEIKNVKITLPTNYEKKIETAIVDAVSKWKIAPARVDGVATEATISVPVLLTYLPYKYIKRNNEDDDEGITALVPAKRSPADTPEALRKYGKFAYVTLEFALDDKGRPQNPVVVLSQNINLDAPALKAILQYRFKKPDPSEPDSLGNTWTKLSEARWQYVINFTPYPIRLEDNGSNITAPVFPLEKVEPVAPVYPYQLLKDNVIGSAMARMAYNAGWTATGPEVIDATRKNFGLALAAAVRFYKVTLKKDPKHATSAMLTTTFEFNRANPDLRLPEKTLQLLADETSNPAKIISEDKLDNPLKIKKPAPAPRKIFYADYTNLKGATVIEFLVDETGRVHLPRIVSAESPDAAYLIMQQISMRVYEPPMQNGKPVVARARQKTILDGKKDLPADKADK